MSITANPSRSRITSAFRWVAASCAILVWLLGLLAFSPQTHGTLHGDAQHQDHTCAITLFSHGVEAATGSIPLAGVPVLFPAGECPPSSAALPAGAAYRLPPGRGPPLS